MDICKHCKIIKNKHIFKVTDFLYFKQKYIEDPTMLFQLDKNGFTFFQNILWSFSRERFKHSNKVLFKESLKALYFILDTIPESELRNILTVESLNQPNFTVLHDYAKNLFSVKEIDLDFIKHLEKLGVGDLLTNHDNDGMSVIDYLKCSDYSKEIISEKQKIIKSTESEIIKLLNPRICSSCGNHLSLIYDIENFDFSKFKGNLEIKQKIELIIRFRKEIQNLCIYKKDGDGHLHIIKVWESKLNEI